ncbi:hypothetical protein [Aureimonas frigidaquae]|uniref:Putative phosphatase n=1 Tax=Aureimonas frigidaquae TaxID=424757 RepID=A0A0P0Z0P7_9HYPH|nr:hypothetical protein [Aureimonas frigidaquae]BAT27419.1 putative phosphatase [Aureimonas frigidaquae]
MSFDLATNPFIALGLATDADVHATTDQIQDAIDDGVVGEDKANRIRQVLTTPRLRIDAELGALLDVEPKLASSISSALRKQHKVEDLEPFVRSLHSLPRSNLLAHLASVFGSERNYLMDLYEAQEACAVGSVLDAVNDERTKASLPPADRKSVEAALEALFRRQMQAAVDGISDPESRATAVVDLVTVTVAFSDRDFDRLDAVVDIYAQSVVGELSRREEQVQSRIQRVRDGKRGDTDLATLRDAVARWMSLTRPMQLLDEGKGRDEPRTRELYEQFNNLGVSVANDDGDSATALRLLHIAHEMFDALPGAVEQIDDNIRIVRGNLAFQKLQPLIRGIEDAETNVHGLNRDLKRWGFEGGRKGKGAELHGLFVAAVDATKGTEVEERPWEIIRGLAVRLTNEHKFAESSAALLRGALRHAQTVAPPKDALERLRSDFATLTDNLALMSVTAHVSGGRLGLALNEAMQARAATRDEDNKRIFGELVEAIQKRKSSRRVKLWVFGVIAAFVGFVILNDHLEAQGRRPSTTRSSSAVSTASQPPLAGHELDSEASIPRIGDTSALTKSELRWCRFQSFRLDEAMKGQASLSYAQNERLNGFIDEWNQRCVDRQYRNGDWSALDTELSTRRAILEFEGRNLAK